MKILSTTNAHPVQITALAAETCYNTIGNHHMKEHKYVSKIIESGHTSVMEHWWVVVEFNCEEIMSQPFSFSNLVSRPGVISYGERYVLLNWRHLYEIEDNFLIDDIRKLVESEYFLELK